MVKNSFTDLNNHKLNNLGSIFEQQCSGKLDISCRQNKLVRNRRSIREELKHSCFQINYAATGPKHKPAFAARSD